MSSKTRGQNGSFSLNHQEIIMENILISNGNGFLNSSALTPHTINNNNNNNYEKYNYNALSVLPGVSAAEAAGNLSMLSSSVVSTPELHPCPQRMSGAHSAPTFPGAALRPKVIGRCTPLKPPKKYRTDGDECEIFRCKRSLNFGGGQRKTGVVGDKKKDAAPPESAPSPSDSSRESGRPRESRRPRESVERRNQRERKRVKQINTTFVTLQNHLPSFCWEHQRPGSGGSNYSAASAGRNYKPSKVDTLRTAIEYIRSLQELVAEHDALVSAQCLSLLQSVDQEKEQQQQHFNTVKNDVISASDVRKASLNSYCTVTSSTGGAEYDPDEANDSFYDVIAPDNDDSCEAGIKSEVARIIQNNGNVDKSFENQGDSLSFIDFDSWIA